MKNRKTAAAALAGVCILTFFADFVSKADEPKQEPTTVVEMQQAMEVVADGINLETIENAAQHFDQRQEEVEQVKAEIDEAARLAADQELLAALIFCEAGGESYEGQLAVGAVVMNRVKSARFPNSVREVVYQRGQFGPALNGKVDRVMAGGRATESCRKAAAQALAGSSPVGGALYFGDGKNYGTKIGGHWFHS